MWTDERKDCEGEERDGANWEEEEEDANVEKLKSK